MSPPELRVAVVGGGPAGLTAAYDLQRAGARVVVYEADAWVGGRTRTDDLAGVRVDAGAQLFASMYTRLSALVEELGMQPVWVRSPGRDALWRDGRVHEVVYGSVTSMLASGSLPLRTKLKLGSTYLPFLQRHGRELDLHAPERAARAGLDEESIAAWGDRELGAEFVEYLAYPQLAAYYGCVPEDTSAGLYHLLARHGMDVSVYAIRGGTARLAETLAERVRRAGGEVRVRFPVSEIAASGDSFSLTGEHFTAEHDAVVVATSAPRARRLVDQVEPELASWLRGVRVNPVITVGLLTSRPIGVRYFGLSLPRSESGAVAALCVQENKGADLVPPGKGALLAILRPDVSPELLNADSRQVIDRILPDLSRVLPGVEPTIERARVYRWPDGNPVMYPGYLRHLDRYRQLRGGSPRIALAGDYLYTPSVEGAVAAGRDAAARVAPLIIKR